MKTLTMTEVAEALHGARYRADTDLPLPNVYWCSVDMPGAGQFHAHLASDHTKAVMHKMANFCATHHGFRPFRGNSQMRVRRLKLGDLIDCPEAHQKALEHARAAGESDVVVALERLPAWILRYVNNPVRPERNFRPAASNDSLWERLTLEVDSLQATA